MLKRQFKKFVNNAIIIIITSGVQTNKEKNTDSKLVYSWSKWDWRNHNAEEKEKEVNVTRSRYGWHKLRTKESAIVFWGLQERIDIKTLKRDFPGGPVVEKQPCNAGNMGSIPGQGTKIPRTGRSTEPVHCNSRSLCTTTRESVLHNERSHMIQQRPCVPQLRPNAAK